MASVRIRGGQSRLSGASSDTTDTPAVVPRREDVVHPSPTTTRTLEWRAIVHVRDLDTAGATATEWHVAACEHTTETDAHCPEGRRMIEQSGQPDGHCLINGRCARCQADQHKPRDQRRAA